MRPNDLLNRAARALRAAGPTAVLNSHTAARLYGCTAADGGPVHLLMPDSRRVRRRGVRIHRGTWERHQVERVHDLRVLALEHTLAEMLCREEPLTAFECLRQALATHPPGLRNQVLAAVNTRPSPFGRERAQIMLAMATKLPTAHPPAPEPPDPVSTPPTAEPNALADTAHDAVPDTGPDTAPDVVSDVLSEGVPDAPPHTARDAVPGTVPTAMLPDSGDPLSPRSSVEAGTHRTETPIPHLATAG
ncbi:hypothetical protein GCM10029964_112560 [Kibdelosporangium lantanae]